MIRKILAFVLIICFFQFTLFASGYSYKFSTFGGGLPSSIKKMAYEDEAVSSDTVISLEDTVEAVTDSEQIITEDEIAGPSMSISGSKGSGQNEVEQTWEEIENITTKPKSSDKNTGAIIGTIIVGTVVVAGLIVGGIMISKNSSVCTDSCDAGCTEDCTTNFCNSCVDSTSDECTQALCDDMISSSCDGALSSSTTSCASGFANFPSMLSLFPVYVP